MKFTRRAFLDGIAKITGLATIETTGIAAVVEKMSTSTRAQVIEECAGKWTTLVAILNKDCFPLASAGRIKIPMQDGEGLQNALKLCSLNPKDNGFLAAFETLTQLRPSVRELQTAITAFAAKDEWFKGMTGKRLFPADKPEAFRKWVEELHDFTPEKIQEGIKSAYKLIEAVADDSLKELADFDKKINKLIPRLNARMTTHNDLPELEMHLHLPRLSEKGFQETSQLLADLMRVKISDKTSENHLVLRTGRPRDATTAKTTIGSAFEQALLGIEFNRDNIIALLNKGLEIGAPSEYELSGGKIDIHGRDHPKRWTEAYEAAREAGGTAYRW